MRFGAVPLRFFLGATFLYAGIQKLTDSGFLNPDGATYIGRQLTGYARSSSATGVAPTTLAYSSYLLATCATGSFSDGVAAVLPCYWIYREVGRKLLARSSPDPLYVRWIETYGGEEFDRAVGEMLELTDSIGAHLNARDSGIGDRSLCHHGAV